MALGSLPPWLNVSPHDFVQAASSGATLGHAIADSTMRAWEEQARMRMAAQESAARRESEAQQRQVDNAMARLSADRLEQYRQSEIANRKAELGLEEKRLGSLDTQQQRADEYARHNLAVEEQKSRSEEAKAKARPTAGIVNLPDAPGYTFLQNPSGALTPLNRPTRPGSDLERARIRLSALNAMVPKSGEDPTSADYNVRTNAIGGILRALGPTPGTTTKRLRYNPATGKLEEVSPLPQPQGGIPMTPTGEPATTDEED